MKVHLCIFSRSCDAFNLTTPLFILDFFFIPPSSIGVYHLVWKNKQKQLFRSVSN